MKSVVLLSGGLDSSTVLAQSVKFFSASNVTALSFDYEQRHIRELESAKNIAQYYNVRHLILKTSFRAIGGSALTSDINVPTNREVEDMNKEIPVTYVPARNTIFLSYALGLAEVIGADIVAFGANHLDYSGYPDCRPEFVSAFNKLSKVMNKRGVEGNPITIVAPIIEMTKAQIIKLGLTLHVPYELTWSCYNGGDKPCGVCDSCKLRIKGFEELGLKDPLMV
jgi:7-cyano-7-deazaguanine synthase